MPSRTRNAATLFFALQRTGFWPVISPSAFTASSINFLSVTELDTPMLTTIFSSLGIDVRIRAAELLGELGHDFLVVALLQPRGRGGCGCCVLLLLP